MDRLAGDVAGIGTDQEGDRRGDFVGQAESGERHALDGALPAGGVERGMGAFVLADIAGDDAIDGDASWRELCRERARKALEPGLGRRRGGEAAAAETE